MNAITTLIYMLIMRGFTVGAAVTSFIFFLILILMEISKNEHSRSN